MNSLDIKTLQDKTEAIAREVGGMLRVNTATLVSSVGKDMKIDVDKKAHEYILKALTDTNIPILSEEDSTYDFNAELQWVVDPLDGSINFLRGIPNCTVSIALLKNREPILGVVYDFNRDEMYTGIVGEGAWCNGEPITVSNTPEKKDALLMTGFPSYTDYSTEALSEYVACIQSYKKIRHIGSASLSLAYVARGYADAYFEKDIKIWDVAAGLALVKSSGGTYELSIVDSEGRCTVTATNGKI